MLFQAAYQPLYCLASAGRLMPSEVTMTHLPDPDELVEFPFILWFMWKTGEPLMEQMDTKTGHPMYSLWCFPEAAQLLIRSRYIKINHEEQGYRQFELTEEGKQYCAALFGNQGKGVA